MKFNLTFTFPKPILSLIFTFSVSEQKINVNKCSTYFLLHPLLTRSSSARQAIGLRNQLMKQTASNCRKNAQLGPALKTDCI